MKKLKRGICMFIAASMLAGCAAAPATENGEPAVARNADISGYGLSELKLTDDYCENALDKEIDYLLSLETDRLLAGFRQNASIASNGVKPYGGWEDSLIGGHTLGHYLTALAQAYENGGTSQSDKKALYAKMTEIIDGLVLCQSDNGFLWGGKIINYGNHEIQFDNVEKGKSDLFNEAWVPWYTMHKIFEGLISVYAETGYQPALDIAKKLGDWTYKRVSGWSEETRRTVLSIEYGGMNDALYDLYAYTGDTKYAEAAHAFDEDELFAQIRSDGKNVLNNRHANTTIPKIIGALKRYLMLDGKMIGLTKVDASEYLETAEVFWQMVVDHHTYHTGGNSEWEHFGEDDVLNQERTNCNCETCNVYNMLKLTRDIFTITGDKKYADYYENAFLNHILASQNPETGMTTYFQAMATGYFRTFSTAVDSFWCCTGSGMENFTKLGDSIYFKNDGGIYVNMYLGSEVKDEALGLTLTQTTDIPETDTAVFKFALEENKKFALRLRIPDWIMGDMTLTLNGEALAFTDEGGYAVVDREWQNGDELSVKIPLGLKAYNLQDGINTVCFRYGPLLLAAKLSDDNMTTTYTGMSVLIPENTVVPNDTLVLNGGIAPRAVKDDPAAYFTKNKGLSFTFDASAEKLEFVPYYTLYNTRYGIYWKLKEAE